MTALLLAEAEPTFRGYLARQLASDGFDVLAFDSPERLPRAAEPDVLLLGDADALERCVVPDCPVIVLGSADAAARVRALAKADDYLSRPFLYEELVGLFASIRTKSLHLIWLEQWDCDPSAIRRAGREGLNGGRNS